MRVLNSPYVGEEENLQAFTRYIDEMLDKIEEQFEICRATIEEAGRQADSSRSWSMRFFVFGIVALCIAWATSIISVLIYDYF